MLDFLGFPPFFIEMVKVLYGEIESVVKVNGGLSASLKVKRGIRQGCSMSGMLYSIAIEPFLCKLRDILEGVSLPRGQSFCLSAYVDDVMVAVRGSSDVEKNQRSGREVW